MPDFDFSETVNPLERWTQKQKRKFDMGVPKYSHGLLHSEDSLVPFLIARSGGRKGYNVKCARIIDIVRNTLELSGLPVPNMDSQSLKSYIDPRFK